MQKKKTMLNKIRKERIKTEIITQGNKNKWNLYSKNCQ